MSARAALPALNLLLIALTLATRTSPVAASGFFVERRHSLRAAADARALQSELLSAMGEALGCGGQVREDSLAKIREALTPVWLTLPKKSPGRVERRSLRYLVHRYFHQKSALQVRGFEPSRTSNASEWGSEDILSQRVPSYVETVLQSKHAHETGFDLQDAVLMVATVEQLLFDSESTLLEHIYQQQHQSPEGPLTPQGLEHVLEEYLIHWVLGEDHAAIPLVIANKTLIQEAVPHWDEMVSMAQGQIKAMEFQRQRMPGATARPGHNALSPHYSFDDAHQVVGGITGSFASWWDSECSSMKASLVQMDLHQTGRVPLSKFYSSALDADWRFGESEAYLRELGALDETSRWYGKQLIIPNYLQSATNCIISTPHYLVCCRNECEGVLREIESSVRRPEATPREILALVGNMTLQATIDHDDPPQLGASIRTQLEHIAETHGGLVPLHGRLFAQWLHYVFPRECPFPHKAGSVVVVTPPLYNENYMATKEEMQKHAFTVNATEAIVGMNKEELEWMSQWSSEEELVADFGRVHPSWNAPVIVGGFLLLVGGITTVGMNRRLMTSEAGVLPIHAKSHLV